MPRAGITIDKWGPAAWNTLHVFAHTAPETLTAMDRASMRTFLNTFGSHLPCSKCRRHFLEFMERHASTDAAFATRKRVVALMNDAHNEVNRRNGKRVYTLAEHYRVYQRPPPRLRLTWMLALFLTLGATCVYARSYATKKKLQT